MKKKSFTDYLVERQIREEDEKIKVDAQPDTSRKAGMAVAKTVQNSNLNLSQAQTDTRVKNKILGKALAKAQGFGASNVNIKSIAAKIDPSMKV